MKKIILLCFSILLVASGLWIGYQKLYTQHPLVIPGREGEDITSIPLVTLVIHEDEHVATYSNIPAPTVFDALYKVAGDQQIRLKTKQYDFGLFVEEIGDKPNTRDHAWIYFVNGISGDVAADKKTLKTGDIVEWRYMQPTF